MPKNGNASDSAQFKITVSKESLRLLHELASRGIWGRNAAEVAARFVDTALQGYAEAPKLKLRSTRSKEEVDE